MSSDPGFLYDFRTMRALGTAPLVEALWAYNERHPEFLEAFVDARLRERIRDDEHGSSNRSLASRLPSWVKAAKNRDEVRKGLGRLPMRLQEVK